MDSAALPSPDVAALYDAHKDVMFRVARRILNGNDDDALDAVGAVILKLVNAADDDRMPHPRNWRSYLCTAARNAAADIIRKRASRDEAEEQEVWVWPTVEDAADQDDLEKRATAALERLPEQQQRIVRLKVFDCETNRSIGARLGISGQAVGQQYRNALKTLHKEVTSNDFRQ